MKNYIITLFTFITTVTYSIFAQNINQNNSIEGIYVCDDMNNKMSICKEQKAANLYLELFTNGEYTIVIVEYCNGKYRSVKDNGNYTFKGNTLQIISGNIFKGNKFNVNNNELTWVDYEGNIKYDINGKTTKLVKTENDLQRYVPK